MFIKLFKFCGVGCLAAGMVFTLLSGTPQEDRGAQRIWSAREVAAGGGSFAEGVYAMQGAEPTAGVDYDGGSPLNEDSYDYRREIESSICELEDAMEESVEIMRSLKMGSAVMLDRDVFDTESAAEDHMRIEDFKMQQLQGEEECISRGGFDNQVLVEVDVSRPMLSSRAIVDEQELVELRRLDGLRGRVGDVVSSATMKVADILFEHGEDERALGMLEAELRRGLRN